MSCEQDDCSDRPCEKYRRKEAELRQRMKQPTIMIETEIDESPFEKPILRAYNGAIDALKVLMEATELDGPASWQKAAALSEELRAERMRRFESLVDWAAIAGKE